MFTRIKWQELWKSLNVQYLVEYVFKLPVSTACRRGHFYFLSRCVLYHEQQFMCWIHMLAKDHQTVEDLSKKDCVQHMFCIPHWSPWYLLTVFSVVRSGNYYLFETDSEEEEEDEEKKEEEPPKKSAFQVSHMTYNI